MCYKDMRTDSGRKKTDTRLYSIWENMKARCYNKNKPKYKTYGAKGIRVCKEWKESFDSFHDWAVLHGYRDSLTLDRKDPKGNYEPSNCRWASNKVQANNKRNSGNRDGKAGADSMEGLDLSAADQKIRDRLDVCRMADRLGLGSIEGLSINEGRERIIKAVSPGMNLDGKDKEYIEAAYTAAKDMYSSRLASGSPDRNNPGWQGRTDVSGECGSDIARKGMICRLTGK